MGTGVAGTGIIRIDLLGLVRHAKGLSVLKRAQNEISNGYYLLEFFPLTIIMATLEDVRVVLMNMWSLPDFLFVDIVTVLAHLGPAVAQIGATLATHFQNSPFN